MSGYGEYGNRQDEFSYLAPTSQAEIIEYCHAIGNLMNEARDMVRRGQVVMVCADGFEITQSMVDDEIARTVGPIFRPGPYAGPMPQVIGLNASSNQFA